MLTPFVDQVIAKTKMIKAVWHCRVLLMTVPKIGEMDRPQDPCDCQAAVVDGIGKLTDIGMN